MMRVHPARLIPIAAAVALLTAGFAGAATRTATFAPVDPGVRASAMGGAFSALGAQPSALYWNPATLYYVRGRSVEAGYSSLYNLGLAKRTYLTLATKKTIDQPQFRGERMVVRRDLETGPAYAVGIQSLFLDLDSEGYSEVAIGAGAAWGYGERLAFGLSFRGLFIGSDLDEVSANGYDLGLGLTFDVSNRERIGVSVPHLMSRVIWKFDSTERLPFSVNAGWARIWSSTLTTTADVELREGETSPYRLAAGIEWWVFPERLALRGGFRHLEGGFDTINKPTFGAGVGFGRLTLDYAFRLGPDALGDTHRMGLQASF